MDSHLISIIIPAYNEALTIERVIRSVASVDYVGWQLELIVVDDGSSDATAAIAERVLSELPPSSRARLVRNETNLGKGIAVKRGFRASTGRLAIIQDADLEYDPREIPGLMAPFLDGRADVVLGSRFIGGRPRRVVYLSNAVGNRLMSLLFSFVSGLKLTDVHCCYMLFDGDLIRAIEPSLQSRRWGFNPEICSVLADWRAELRIVEMGISYYGRSKEEGKKIRFRHGAVAVLEILKFNLRKPLPLPRALASERTA
jgi:glycosyltransferase involved in cell wall biosynthesis